jgi:hypothetical protein
MWTPSAQMPLRRDPGTRSTILVGPCPRILAPLGAATNRTELFQSNSLSAACSYIKAIEDTRETLLRVRSLASNNEPYR